MRIRRQLAGLVAGAGLAAGALFGTAAPAQAYSPDPDARDYHPATKYCPCSGGDLSDPFDGTYFEKDEGNAVAYKSELYSDGWFVGKVEFHPLGEQLWVYDTKNDSDSFYVEIGYYYDNGDSDTLPNNYRYLDTVQPPGTSDVVDLKIWNEVDIPEDAQVEIVVYDNGYRDDWITESIWARA